MIELPAWAVPDSAAPALIDFGGVLRPDLGGPLQRIDRQGSRYRIALTFPPFGEPDRGRAIVSRLIRAKRMGLRVEFPLPGPQAIGGIRVVDGAGQAGTTLRVRGIRAHSVIGEGFWLSIERPNGQHFLHNVAAQTLVGADGTAAIALSEMLRVPFPDGARVHLARPMIEGLVDGNEQAWRLSVEQQTEIEVMIEEAA